MSVKASCGCVGQIVDENFIPTQFNCDVHEIGTKYVFSLNIRKQRMTIEVNKIKPHLNELILRCGGIDPAAEFIGLGAATLHRIQKNHYRTVQMKTARAILNGLIAKREQDRRNGKMDSQFIKELREKANREEKMKF